MMRLNKILIAFLAVAALLASAQGIALASADVGAGRDFLDGVAAYEAGDFAQAAADFEKVAGRGIENPDLFYDLGNAWLKAGELGRAMLWYERAAFLDPSDPDIEYNLRYARSLTVDKQPAQGGPLASVLFFPERFLAPQGLCIAALAVNLALWLCLAGLLLAKRRGLKSAFKSGLLACAALLLVIGPSAVHLLAQRASGDTGFVLAKVAPVRSGLSESATELFSLHAGSRVRLGEARDGYLRVFFAQGKEGWISAADVARLWPVGRESASVDVGASGE